MPSRQRRNGEVEDGLAGRLVRKAVINPVQLRLQNELVDVMNASIAAHIVELLIEVVREQLRKRAAECVLASDAGEAFDLSVPALDTVF